MRYNIKLGDKKRLFCKNCFHPYGPLSIRVKKGIISATCNNCGYKSRRKVKD